MSDEKDEPRGNTAREEFEQARERYQRAREQERDAHRDERQRAREAGRGLRDEIRRTMRESIRGGDVGRHIGRSIRDSMNFNIDLGDLADMAGDEYTEVVERDFAVGGMPRLHVRNVSGDTRLKVGPAGAIHVTARKRVRGTSEERAKRLLENVEVRMEQDGDDIVLKPHLYEQDRGWADLFRGGRVAVDFDVTVPRELRLEAQTVSGDLVVNGTRGPIEAQSVSGDVRLEDVQGPLRLKTVSGDAIVQDFAGQLVGNTVSGDLNFEHVRLHGSDVVTVSGDVRIDGELERSREHRVKTISGDVDLRLSGGSYDIRFVSVSGGLESQLAGDVNVSGRRDKHVIVGAAETKVTVKTMSGDLELRASSGGAPEASPAAEAEQPEDVERTEPMEPATEPAPNVDVRDLLARVARGEVDVDAAAAELDARRGH
jgi:cytoskeletal protein CcmA (bactofilin family)